MFIVDFIGVFGAMIIFDTMDMEDNLFFLLDRQVGRYINFMLFE